MRRSILNLLELLLGTFALIALGACSFSSPNNTEPVSATQVSVKLVAFNDFHGALDPTSVVLADPASAQVTRRVPAGGAKHLAAMLAKLRVEQPNTMVISAGDLVGASPLSSALTLDEGTIELMNLLGVDFNAVGNHEFDRGVDELMRLQYGGCQRLTALVPCRVNPSFKGASFRFLSANVITRDGRPLFPATGMRTFGQGRTAVTVGVIGLTLRETPSLVTPSGVSGLTFEDEAQTINRLAPRLRAQGADVVVVAIHQGGETQGDMNDRTCPGLGGPIVPVLERIDVPVDLVITGHTHRAYACDYALHDPAKSFWVTSAGQYGTLVTDIDLTYDTQARRVVKLAAVNRVVEVQPTGLKGLVPAQGLLKEVSDLVERYTREAEPLARRVVGRIGSDLNRVRSPSGESLLGNLVADAQWHATRHAQAGASELALMNPGGLRADLLPDPDTGQVTYAQLFAAQPFGNTLVVMSLSGLQLRRLLEQQFSDAPAEEPRVLLPSSSLSYRYDLRRAAGQRVSDIRIGGRPVTDTQTYRITVNSFLASGGDRFSVLREGRDIVGGPIDVEALEAYIAAHPKLDAPDLTRISGDRRVGRATH